MHILALLGVYWSEAIGQYMFMRHDPHRTAPRCILLRDLESTIIGDRPQGTERHQQLLQGLVLIGVALDDDLAWLAGHSVLWDSAVSSPKELANL